eukprot:CAMPEP_0172933562 /NCGR_PEP_ID=MMETSP1075-20121228/220570_1 /TAXON_ID=2916 /ORGANISM="Ceratium fusus, Strain PA161109" /LENGTH=909 /DNA_ID=CAMNT_0013794905 /DNA_START=90 /DNA_END=2819 /DNA_ORIENTATION=-
MTGPSVAFSVAVDGRSAKDFELRRGEGKVIKVGRYPKSHVVLDHPGVSNQHLELKLIPAYKGVAVRDVSSNGTGMQLAGSEEALRLEKDVDTPLPDDALILLPFHVKGNKTGTPTLRAGLRVRVLNVPLDVVLGNNTGTTAAASETLASTLHDRPVVELQQHEKKWDESNMRVAGSGQCEVGQVQQQARQQHDLERQKRRREKRARKDDRQKQERGRKRSKIKGKSKETLADDTHDGQRQAGCSAERRELDRSHGDQRRSKRPRHSDKKSRRHSGRDESERIREQMHQVEEIEPQQCERARSIERVDHEIEAGLPQVSEVLAFSSHEQHGQDHEDNDRRGMESREGMLATLPEENTHQGQEEEGLAIREMAWPNEDLNHQGQLEPQWQEQKEEEYKKQEFQELLHGQTQEHNKRQEVGCPDAQGGGEYRERQDMEPGEQEEQARREIEPAEHQEDVYYQAPKLEDSFHMSEKESIDRRHEEDLQRERVLAASHTHEEVVAVDASKSGAGTGIVAAKPEDVGGSQELAPVVESATALLDVDDIKLAPEGTGSVHGGARLTADSSSKLVAASSSRRTGLSSGIGSGASLPRWVALGHRLHWWSESRKTHLVVKVTKLDELKRIVIVTFESDSKVWKSVPYSQFGRSSCPLRPLPNSAQSDGQPAQADRTGAALRVKATITKEKKRERSRTPEWWQMENQRSVKEQAAERERQLQEQQKREQERLRDEKRRKELMEAEQRKVQEAFEQRKREAEELRLREEEEWREGLRRQREQEAAQEALEMAGLKDQEREERKQRRREEKERAKREEIQERERILAEEKLRQQQERLAALQAPLQASPCSGSHHTQPVAPPAPPPVWPSGMLGQMQQQNSWHGMGAGAAPWAPSGGPAWGWPNAALVNPMYCQRPVPYQT